MAIAIHVVNVAFLPVNKRTGAIVLKNNPTTKISDVMETEHRHVILPADDVPNSAGYPTVKDYLKLEAAGDFVVRHMDQTTIVTYDQGGVNSAT